MPRRSSSTSNSSEVIPHSLQDMGTVVDGGLRSDDDIMLDKRGWSSFAGTDLDRTLRDHGVTQGVVVGLATTSGVESTARQADHLGFTSFSSATPSTTLTHKSISTG